MSFPRYEAYKQSGIEWLGEVPENWCSGPIGSVSSCNDDILAETTHPDFEIQYVEISDVESGRGISGSTVVLFADAPSRARRKVKDGDVIISTVRTYLKAIAQVEEPPENMIVSTGFAVLRPRRVDSRFLGYLLKSEYVIAEILSRSVGVSYPAINASEILRIKVPLPPSCEQGSIVAFLDHETAKIDALVEEQQRLIELLKEKRQAVISHAVTKGLDPNAPMKDSGVEWLGEVPEHWEVTRFLRAFNVVYRYPTYFDISYVEKGIPEIRGEALGSNGKIVWLDDMRFIDSETNARFPMTQLDVDDFVMSVRGTLGKVGLVTDEFSGANITANLLRLSPNSTAIPKFLLWFMLSHVFREQLDIIGSQTTIKTITIPQLNMIHFSVPPLEQQDEICEWLDKNVEEIDVLMATVESAIALLQERRSALISAAVTGKIDVRGLMPVEAEAA